MTRSFFAGDARPANDALAIWLATSFSDLIYLANLGAADQFFETSELVPSLRQSLRPSVGTMSWRLDSRVRLAGHPASLSQNQQNQFSSVFNIFKRSFINSSYFFGEAPWEIETFVEGPKVRRSELLFREAIVIYCDGEMEKYGECFT